MRPATGYAKSGDVSIAYQVIGAGGVDLVLVPGFVSHVELAWEEPRLARFLTALASFSRLIVFDKRGTGMSDPMTAAPSMVERMDDIRAVMDAAGSPRAALFGISEGGSLSLLFAHNHPERTQALIMYGSWARRVRADDYAWGPDREQLEEVLARMDRAWATGEWWDQRQRSPNGDEQHREWWARYLRQAASPTMARQVIRLNAGMDLRELLPLIDVSTLILHRVGDTWIEVGHGRYLAENIRGARYVELPGADHRPWLGDTDAIVAEVEIFLLGRRTRTRRRTSLGLGGLAGASARWQLWQLEGRPPGRSRPTLPQRANRGVAPCGHLHQAWRSLQGGADPPRPRVGGLTSFELIPHGAGYSVGRPAFPATAFTPGCARVCGSSTPRPTPAYTRPAGPEAYFAAWMVNLGPAGDETGALGWRGRSASVRGRFLD